MNIIKVLIIAISLSLSACAKESDKQNEGTVGSDQPSNTSAGMEEPTQDDETGVTETEPDAEPEIPEPVGQPPSRSVDSDCMNNLPCSWSTADAGVSVVVSDVRRDIDQPRRIAFDIVIQTTRDTTVRMVLERLGYKLSYIDAEGRENSRFSMLISDSNNNSQFPFETDVLAGIPVNATHIFTLDDEDDDTSAIARYQLNLSEAGIYDYFPSFRSLPTSNLSTLPNPLGSASITGAPGTVVDCQNIVPCEWVSTDGKRIVQILDVAPSTGQLNSLIITYAFKSEDDYVITGSATEIQATGQTGAIFENVSQMEIGAKDNFHSDIATEYRLYSGIPIRGYLRFREEIDPSIEKLDFQFVYRSNTQSDNPRFMNLPGFPEFPQ